MPKLAAFEDFRAPWETEAGADTDIDKARLKRYIYNLQSDKQKAQEQVEALTTERDTLKKSVDEKAREGESENDRLKRELKEAQEKAAKGGETSKETLKLRVALRKGLSEVQAKRLVGDTEEELVKDADELLESFGGAGNGKSEDGEDGEDGEEGTPPTRQPRQVRNPVNNGGGGGTGAEIDIEKAIAGMPRFNSF